MLYRGQCSTLKGPADVSQWQHWTVRSLFHGIPHSGWDERGQRIQHSSRGCSPQSTGQSRGIQGLWERPGGLSPHLDHGEDGHFTPNSSYGESPKIPLGQLFKCSWERLHWPRFFFLTRLHSKTRIELLWQSVNHGNGRLSVARVICARSQDLLNPWGDSKFNDWAVLETRLKRHWQIWGAGRKSREEPESLFFIPSENAISQLKQTGGRPIQCNRKV